ncbi:MAG: hypothetical protein PUJ51_25210 [Clostridiales bacterium]|uniref:hypothetical protein n=1 Tax=Terrisporobacter sp. TaxID=1965305 RepID=UPI002A57BD56|nr:hypothetical protein [Terrisporobacter sp.]MDD7757758.1 hypothetical protein [Clostridiales bacterium]MDY3777440.1 hypothetical protein [Candidatus Onthovivens sp.]MDY4136493.1 hypothetical protein [Terrisporobacter sp.]
MNEEINTISEEQVLHNKLSFEINQELIHLMKRIVELQQENARLKDKIDRINKLLNEPIFEYDNIPCNIENEIIQLKDILKEN